MTAGIAVVQFPGTNCEHDVVRALRAHGIDSSIVWHTEPRLDGYDGVVLPGGFAHGDYLRTGAIARFSPVMRAVSAMAAAGAPVVGICNGFQVLCEAGLLPGALQKNAGLRFLCETVQVRVETAGNPLTKTIPNGSLLDLPINHFEGNFTCDDATYESLIADDRVVFRYCDNPNGSRDAIAGICGGPRRNVVGLMPHPERACDPLVGGTDGRTMFASLAEWLASDQ